MNNGSQVFACQLQVSMMLLEHAKLGLQGFTFMLDLPQVSVLVEVWQLQRLGPHCPCNLGLGCCR